MTPITHLHHMWHHFSFNNFFPEVTHLVKKCQGSGKQSSQSQCGVFFLSLNTWTVIIMCWEWHGAYKRKVMICKVNLTGQLDSDGFVRWEEDWTVFLLCEEGFIHTLTRVGSDSLVSICYHSVGESMLVSASSSSSSCVWYSVGGIQGSPLKFMDQVCWLLSTVACCNKVTFPGFHFSIAIGTQLLGPWTSASTALGVTENKTCSWCQIYLTATPACAGIHWGIWNTCVSVCVSSRMSHPSKPLHFPKAVHLF